ncbi:hypothetical protein JL722_3604 [Aureococcus anophagefferens]|nr:hypothetical protein JL722_3604 [Aureococcus anophagefferens]
MADYEQPNEEEEEETFGTEVQERAMFLLDLTTADLLEQTGAATFETRLEAAMKIVLAFIKGRLVGGGKDVVKAWLAAADAHAVKSEEGSLRNGFHACQRAFDGHGARDASSSIIYVFSAAAEPYASPAERDVCLTFAQDAADVALEVHVAHFGLDDELDAFWGPLLKANAPPDRRGAPADWLRNAYPPRAPTIRVARRTLARAPGALAQKKVDANTGELVTTTSQDFDATTASILDASAIRTYVPLGPLADAAEADVKRANRCYVDRAQFKECDDASDVLGFGDGEVALLGFAARGDVFPGGAELVKTTHASLLAPDDDLGPGSSQVLSALIEAMREERVVGLARYVKRKHAACPRLVVLAPDDRGLLFHELPFGDERRDTRGAPASLKRPREDEGDDAAETAAALDAALGALVAALSGRARDGGPADPARVFNPARRNHFAFLDGRDDALDGRVAAVEAALPAGGVAARAAKKPKPAAAARVPKELLVDPLNRDALKANFTAPALKATAEDLGLAKSGTKDAIINRIAQFLADGGQVPP